MTKQQTTQTMTIQQIARDHLHYALSQTDFKTVRRFIRKSFADRTAATVDDRNDTTAHVYRDRHVYAVDSGDFKTVVAIINRVASSSKSLRSAAAADAAKHAK